METRDKDAVTAEVEQASSRILEIIDVKGKTTELGALTMPCSDDYHQEDPYYAYDPWSLYKAPFAELRKAMNRLRVVRNGPRQDRRGPFTFVRGTRTLRR